MHSFDNLIAKDGISWGQILGVLGVTLCPWRAILRHTHHSLQYAGDHFVWPPVRHPRLIRGGAARRRRDPFENGIRVEVAEAEVDLGEGGGEQLATQVQGPFFEPTV